MLLEDLQRKKWTEHLKFWKNQLVALYDYC
jgi:hypothetical protein